MSSPKTFGARLLPAWPWLAVIGLLVVLAASSVLDQQAESHYQQALKRALVTAGLARALNGVISVLQGTEIAVEPAGVGVTFTPGELLDPVNDLIERFSWLMVVASVSLVSQQTLLVMSGWWGVRLLLGVSGACLLASRLSPADSRWRGLAPAGVRFRHAPAICDALDCDCQ